MATAASFVMMHMPRSLSQGRALERRPRRCSEAAEFWRLRLKTVTEIGRQLLPMNENEQSPASAGSSTRSPASAASFKFKARLTRKDEARAEAAERQLHQTQVLAAEAVAQQKYLEQALKMQDQLALNCDLAWLAQADKEKAALRSELENMVKEAELETGAEELKTRLLELELEEATAERDKAVQAATRAMTIPELQGDEYEVLQELLKAKH
jgi:hypothetical protein